MDDVGRQMDEWTDEQMDNYSDVGTGGTSKLVAEGAWPQWLGLD